MEKFFLTKTMEKLKSQLFGRNSALYFLKYINYFKKTKTNFPAYSSTNKQYTNNCWIVVLFVVNDKKSTTPFKYINNLIDGDVVDIIVLYNFH